MTKKSERQPNPCPGCGILECCADIAAYLELIPEYQAGIWTAEQLELMRGYIESTARIIETGNHEPVH